VQQYEAAKNKYYQDLAKWRTRRVQILGRPLTFDEMYGIFNQGVSFPVPAYTGPAAVAPNNHYTPGPL